ncbi:myb-related transcription factor, partner of profilin-like [Rana temporaria]|uniref:myb-related transcription factor, partner of profilin-like n=1 Tax=Rana temporaria TaxID=8407 RepID=UPI001AADB0EA|nr:myb-related transcription factor, partner of profilin-like [Rana temporaria]
MKITDFFPLTPGKDTEDKSVTSGIQGQRMSHGANTGVLSIQTPKKRKERFTDQEIHALVDAILEHIEQLFGRKAANAAGKAAIWDEVVRRVNVQGNIQRTLPECKKKWDDYKRKIKKTINMTKSSTDNISMEERLHRRQMTVAKFFKWDKEGTSATQLLNNSLLDEGEMPDSEDDFIVNQNEEISSENLTVDSPEDMCIPHSSAADDHHHTKPLTEAIHSPDTLSKQSFEHHKTKPLKTGIHSSADISKQTVERQKKKTLKENINSSADVSKPSKYQAAETSKEIIEPTSTESPQQQLPNWDSKLDQLIAQQRQTNEILSILRQSVSESLKLQKRMSRVLKTNFLELQKSIISNQEISNEQSRALENTMKSVQAKMNEISNQLRVKQLQEFMSSDDSDLDIGTPRMLSSPLNKELTPRKKRKLNETPSSSGSLKKKGKKNVSKSH